MSVAVILIIAGIVLLIYPQLLSIIVAAFLIAIGVALLSLRYQIGQQHRELEGIFRDFFARF